MTTQQDTRTRDQDTAFLGLILAAIVLGGALPALIAGFILFRYLRNATPGDRDRQIFVVFLALVGLGVAYLFRDLYPLIPQELRLIRRTKRWDELWPFIKVVWVLTFPAAPWMALALNTFRSKSMEEQMAERAALAEAKAQRQRKKAQRAAAKAPPTVNNALVLGSVIGGDLHSWQQKQWLTYPQRELAEHAVAIGGSGSGKTETLLRIAFLAAKVYGWQVFYLDAKGEARTAARFLASIPYAGKMTVPCFPQWAINGWQGDGRAIVNRLHALQTFSEPYYADVAMQVLTLAVNAPAGVPRSSTELVRRLGLDVLRELYQGHPDAFKVERLRAEDVRGVYQRYAGFFDALDGKLDGDWSWEDVDSAYLLLHGTAFKRESQSLGRFLVEDLAHYVTDRKPRDRKVLIIIDEFSALSMSADAANLFERIRSFGAAVIVSSQSYAGLGDTAERLLGAATTIILQRCSDPEQITRRAGTVRNADYSYHLDQRGAPGRMTLHQTDAPRIDPNVVRQLGVGEAFVIAHGHAAQVQVAPIAADETAGMVLVERGGWGPFTRHGSSAPSPTTPSRAGAVPQPAPTREHLATAVVRNAADPGQMVPPANQAAQPGPDVPQEEQAKPRKQF